MVKLIDGTGIFSGTRFHPVVPAIYQHPFLLRDFTKGMAELPQLGVDTGFVYDVGRYNERRRNMYTTDLFGAADPWAKTPAEVRDIHMGLDIGGPVGTAVHLPADGKIHAVGYNPEAGDCACRLF